MDDLKWFYDAGGRFVPISAWDDKKSKSPGKKPIYSGWQDSPYGLTIQRFIDRGLNVGLLCGAPSAGLCMLDADERYSELCAKIPGIDKAPTVIRAGADKGKVVIKILGEIPAPRQWYHQGETHPFFELLTTGRAAVIPPSRHPTGVDYQLINADQPIPELMASDVADICKAWTGEDFGKYNPDPQPERTYTKPAYTGGDSLRDKVRAAWGCLDVFTHFGWVTQTEMHGRELKILDHGGLFVNEDDLWNIPARGKGYGGDCFDAWMLCKTDGQQYRAPRDKTFKELLFEMAAAANIALPEEPRLEDKPPAVNINTTQVADTDEPPPPRYTVHDASETLLPAPPRVWVMDQLILERSLNLWVGKFGSKKTWSMLSAAVCIALKKPWLGFEVPKDIKVLYIDQDMGEEYTREYMAQCVRGELGEGSIAGKLSYISGAGFDLFNQDDLNLLYLEIIRSGAELVFMDALRNFTPGRDENSVKDMQPALNALRHIASAARAALVVSHHENRAGEWSGSTAIPGGVDCVLSIKSEEGKPIIFFKTGKKRSGKPQNFAGYANWVEGASQFYLNQVDLNEIKPTPPRALDVRNYFEEQGDKSFPELQAFFDRIGRSKLYDLIDYWVDKGVIERKNPNARRGTEAIYGLTQDKGIVKL